MRSCHIRYFRKCNSRIIGILPIRDPMTILCKYEHFQNRSRGPAIYGLNILSDKSILCATNSSSYQVNKKITELSVFQPVKGGFTLIFVKLDFEIAVDQQTRAHDQTFEGVPESGCPPVPVGQPRPYLVNFCQITLTCSQPCFGVIYL